MSATDKKLDELTADLGHRSTEDLTEFYRQVDRFAQLPANPPPGFAVEVVPVIPPPLVQHPVVRWSAMPCCEAMERLERVPGEDTTLVGWSCPIHGVSLYRPAAP